MKISKTCCSVYNEAITTKIGSIKLQDNEACTGIIPKKLYELVPFLQSYDVHKVEFFIRSDRFKVGVDNK